MLQKPLILLHGALGSKEQFNQLSAELSSSFDVHAFNFEGHGGGVTTRPFSMEYFAENVLEYMEAIGLKSASFFGYSMGGYVALTLAQKDPNRVEKVVTFGTKFDWTPAFAASEVRKLNPEKIAEKVPRFAEFLEKVHAPSDWRKVMIETANMMIALGENNPLEKHYSLISTATLIALGSLDNMSTEEESRNVAKQLPNAEFKLIADFEHPIEKVNHAELAQIITHFLDA